MKLSLQSKKWKLKQDKRIFYNKCNKIQIRIRIGNSIRFLAQGEASINIIINFKFRARKITWYKKQDKQKHSKKR